MSHAGELSEFLTQTFEAAFGLHTAGQLDQAELQYRVLLEVDEEHAAGWHYLGVLLHQAGRHQEALDCLQHAATLAPHQADWCNDRGNVLFAAQDYQAAVTAYQQALTLRPEQAQFWNNHAAALQAQGQSEAAIASCLQALQRDPQFVPALLQLATLYQQRGERMLASRYQCLAYVLPPYEGKSPELLAVSHYFLGQVEQAAQVCRQWLADDPANPVARHMLDAYSGQPRDSASSDYIARRFDEYADHFDRNLVDNLAYRGPQLLAALLEQTLGAAQPRLDVLDAGCGTGLCAAVLRPRARYLAGVDLSANMLRHARARGSYDHLAQAELSDWMTQQSARYDLIVACDVLIYSGQLERLFASAHQALRADGHFLFSAESADEDPPQGQAGTTAAGWSLHPSGRFRHRRGYLEDALQAAGFAVCLMQPQSLRVEMQQPVPGLLVLARRCA